MKLYELADQIEFLINSHIDPETGELSEDCVTELAALEVAFEEKAVNVALYIKGLRAEADAVKAEALKLNARKESLERQADNLEGYLATHLGQGEEIKDPRVVVKWSKSTAVGVIEGYEPSEGSPYCIAEAIVKLDKRGALKALRNGEHIQGLFLEERQKLSVR